MTDNILSLTAKQGVIPYAEKEDVGGNKPKQDLTLYNVAHENDLLVNCMNVVSGAAGVSKYHGAISPVYYALYPRQNENVWYYHYIFRLVSFQRSLVGLGKGIQMHESEDGTLTTVRMRISMDSLGNVLLPVPPRAEQDQIVRFLDWKVSLINRLIGIKRRQIEKLEEMKKAVIYKTVTKGLYDDVPMKDSGVEWIGYMPKCWTLEKIKHHFIIENGCDPKLSGDIPVYGSGNGSFKSCGEYKTGPTVLLGRKGATLHIPHYIEGKYWNVDTAFNTIKKSNGYVDMKFFYYIAGLFDYNFFIKQTTLPSMKQSDYNNMLIAIPPISEQSQIVLYIEKKIDCIDNMMNNIRLYINNLQELKTRLIADTVTGKIDVRNIEIPEYEFVADDIVDEYSEEDTDIAENTDQ